MGGRGRGEATPGGCFAALSPQLWLFAHSPSAWGPRPLRGPKKKIVFSSCGGEACRNAPCLLFVLFASSGSAVLTISPPRLPQKAKLQGRGQGGGVRPSHPRRRPAPPPRALPPPPPAAFGGTPSPLPDRRSGEGRGQGRGEAIPPLAGCAATPHIIARSRGNCQPPHPTPAAFGGTPLPLLAGPHPTPAAFGGTPSLS